MTELSELFTRERPPVAVRATVANTPEDGADDLYVLVESFDGAHQRFGPCYFAPKAGELPARHDDALVVFDENGQPWVTVWWNGSAEVGGGGEPGPEGPPGPAGGAVYVHSQLAAASTWTITHALGIFPNVTVVDSLDRQMITDLDYLDANTIQVTLSAATAGKAYLS
jgi:hypothetical protein